MESELQDVSPISTSPRPSRRAKAMLIVGMAAVGAGIGGAGIANAATSSSSTNTASTAAPSTGASATPVDPAKMTHGPDETLLTGTTAEKVKAAALAADPGATIIRVETDSAGSPYEAHITKADGTQATLKIDAGFKVTATESGFGGGPGGPGGHGPGGPGSGAPAATSPSA